VELIRPYPPESILDGNAEQIFIPAPDVEQWLRQAFIEEGYETHNEDHFHLNMAQIGVLWTNVEYTRKMRAVAGTAELCKPPSTLNAWGKARWWQQVEGWFNQRPDFIITLDALYSYEADNPTFMALVEHELRHCALVRFTNQGMPIWGIRGHDYEFFLGDVERYGIDAAGIRPVIEAASKPPLISGAAIRSVCGNCNLQAA
jgi:hypothetical protein